MVFIVVKLPKEMQQGKKGVPAGKIDKKCMVQDCHEMAIRSLSKQKWEPYIDKAKLKIVESKKRNLFLCKAHYKEANKIRKSEKKATKKNVFTEGDQFRGAGGKKRISPWDK